MYLWIDSIKARWGSQYKLLENLILVYSVSGANLFFSILVNLIVPISANKLDYANFRLLILYANYAGFFHFGLLNGLYLAIIGKDLFSIEWEFLRKTKNILLLLQAFAIPLIVIVMTVLVDVPGLTRPILISSALGWILANLITFYTYLLQGTGNFRLHTIITIVSRILGIVLISYFVFTNTTSTPNLIITFLAPLILSALFYEIYWRKLGQMGKGDIVTVFPTKQIQFVWQRGLSLYTANVGLAIMFSLGNLWVSLFFNPLEFADFAFAYGFISVTYIVIDGLALAIAPLLANKIATGSQDVTTQYANLLLIWFPPAMYWVIHMIVGVWYPQYAQSLPMMLLFSATLPFTAIIRGRLVAVATASGREMFLLRYSLIGLLIVALAVGTSFYVSQTVYAIAVGWSLAIALIGTIGGVVSSYYLPQPPAISDMGLSVNALIASLLLFFLASQLDKDIMAMSIYVVVAFSMLWFMWRYNNRPYFATPPQH
ncbi:MAG: hypothetical protein OT477_12835 [Chloroflexi bacterium]|nr:hypothetical protein [Chloroflexota bacterium]